MVDTVGKKDDKNMNARSVFVGNLSFDMDEEELRKFFDDAIDDIEGEQGGDGGASPHHPREGHAKGEGIRLCNSKGG